MQVGSTIESGQGLNQGAMNVATSDAVSQNSIKKLNDAHKFSVDELTKQEKSLTREDVRGLHTTENDLCVNMNFWVMLAEILGKLVEKNKDKLTDILNKELERNEFLTKEFTKQSIQEELAKNEILSGVEKEQLEKAIENPDMVKIVRANASKNLDKIKDNLDSGMGLENAIQDATQDNKLTATDVYNGLTNEKLSKDVLKASDTFKDTLKDTTENTNKDVVDKAVKMVMKV